MFAIDLSARLQVHFGSYRFSFDNPIFWISVAIIILFFLRHWGIKRLFSFSIITSILIFLMFKADAYIINIFGVEEGGYYALLTKPLFVFVIVFVFIYYGFIMKD